jgi:hypothetical protein
VSATQALNGNAFFPWGCAALGAFAQDAVAATRSTADARPSKSRVI